MDSSEDESSEEPENREKLDMAQEQHEKEDKIRKLVIYNIKISLILINMKRRDSPSAQESLMNRIEVDITFITTTKSCFPSMSKILFCDLDKQKLIIKKIVIHGPNYKLNSTVCLLKRNVLRSYIL